MVVKEVYIIRHGYREDWVTETPHLPTNLPQDPPLSELGLKQANEVGEYLKDKNIERVYCSPFYRCLQTVTPLVKATGVPLYIDNSMSEWYGKAYERYRNPAPIEQLKEMFPHIDTNYTSSIPLPEFAEDTLACHHRLREGLDILLDRLDKEPNGPSVILLAGHAASVIAAVRSLLDNAAEPVRPAVASVCKLVRNDANGWNLVANGYVSHLSDGAHRAWTFSGDIPDYEKRKMIKGEAGPL